MPSANCQSLESTCEVFNSDLINSFAVLDTLPNAVLVSVNLSKTG